MPYDGTCGESCYRNQACYNQKDKYEDGNLKCALVLLTAAKECLLPARDVAGQMMEFPAWTQRYFWGQEQD